MVMATVMMATVMKMMMHDADGDGGGGDDNDNSHDWCLSLVHHMSW